MSFGVTVLLSALFHPTLASGLPGRSATGPAGLVDSLQHLILAEDHARAPGMSRRHLEEVESRTEPDSALLAEAIVRFIEAHLIAHPRHDSEVVMALGRIARLDARTRLKPRIRAAILRAGAKRFHVRGEADSSLIRCHAAESILVSDGRAGNPELAAVLKLRALSLRGSGRISEAESVIVRGCAILERACGADSDSLWDMLDYRASNHSGPGRMGRAIAEYAVVLDRHRRLFGPNSHRVAATLYRAGGTEALVGRFDRAQGHAEEAIRIQEREQWHGTGSKYAASFDLLGWCMEEAGNHELAESLYARSLEIHLATSGKDHVYLTFPRSNRARMLISLGKFEAASAEADEIARLMKRRDPLGGQSNDFLEVQASAALGLGDTARARGYIEAREHREREVGDLPSPLESSGRMIRAWWSWLTGDAAAALDAGLASAAIERAEVLRQALSLTEGDALAYRRNTELGLDLAITAVGDPAQSATAASRVHDALVRSRALVFDAMIARHHDLVSAADSSTRVAMDSLASTRQRLIALTHENRKSGNLEAADLRGREYVLLAQLQQREPGMARLGRRSAIGLDEVSSFLKQDETLVSYVRFAHRDEPCGSARDRRLITKRYGAFVLRFGSPLSSFIDLGPADRIDTLIDEWRALITKRSEGRAARVRHIFAIGDSLRRRLVDPVVPVPGTVHIVADGSIALVSFDVLPTPTGRLLVETDYRIQMLTAERDLVPDPGDIRASHGLLALGGADFDRSRLALEPASDTAESASAASASDPRLSLRFTPRNCNGRGAHFPSLPQSRMEALEIGSMARKRHVQELVLLGAEASEESFRLWAPRHAILHVASHGYFLADSCTAKRDAGISGLLRSGIVLAGANTGIGRAATERDGVLTAEEIGELDLRGTRCAVLSACESGLGSRIDGEGVLGLRRAFRTAGATAIVSSLWIVEDLWARLWMREFYRGVLDRSLDIASSARMATRALVERQRAQGLQPDPFHCGAFIATCSAGTPTD